MIFANRQDAGEKLGKVLHKFSSYNTVVLGVPRGGVVVAAKVAEALKAPLDIIIPRKIGAPHNREVAIGAVTQDGTVISDEAMMRMLDITENQLQLLADKVAVEISRRVTVYRGGRPGTELQNRTVIVVDDGVATGFTIKAALLSVRKANPDKLVLAVPVAPADTVKQLRELVDELVCLEEPDLFYAVGQFYVDFEQTEDSEVIEILNRFRPVSTSS